MVRLEIVTTTYNRKHLLPRLHNSLKKIENVDFTWIIQDDGSKDGTRTLVESWVSESKFEIRYEWAPNGGMHVARNKALERCTAEFYVIIDDDDEVVPENIPLLIDFLEKAPESVVGIIFPNTLSSGALICDLSHTPRYVGHLELKERWKVRGDVKYVLKTRHSKKYPYPEIKDERFMPASYKYINLDNEGIFEVANVPICLVHLSGQRATLSRKKQFLENPKSFELYRKLLLSRAKSNKLKLKTGIHLNLCFILQRKFTINDYSNIYTIITFPASIIFYIFLKIRA